MPTAPYPTQPMLQHNVYYNYYGGSSVINSGGSGGVNGDSNPITEDPKIFGWTYTVAPASPVFNSIVNWTAIPGGWGPPGFVIPQTGTKPSSPY